MKIVAWFQIVIGLGIGAVWVLLLTTGQVPEVAARQRDIWFHIGAEFATALLLLAAGAALLVAGGTRARLLAAFALGALLYTTVNSSGYYADLGEWAVVAAFAVLTAATAAAFVTLLRTGSGQAG